MLSAMWIFERKIVFHGYKPFPQPAKWRTCISFRRTFDTYYVITDIMDYVIIT
jgi:hypothetical protein